jgi:hypothetical protein
MKPVRRHHLVATIFPASMLDVVRRHSDGSGVSRPDEVVILRGMGNISGRRVRMIAEEFVRSGKTIRVVRSL